MHLHLHCTNCRSSRTKQTCSSLPPRLPTKTSSPHLKAPQVRLASRICPALDVRVGLCMSLLLRVQAGACLSRTHSTARPRSCKTLSWTSAATNSIGSLGMGYLRTVLAGRDLQRAATQVLPSSIISWRGIPTSRMGSESSRLLSEQHPLQSRGTARLTGALRLRART